VVFAFGGWLEGIAIDDGLVRLALAFEAHDGFDPSSNCGSSALVCAACDEVVEFGQERHGQPYGDLFCGHQRSIPIWYS